MKKLFFTFALAVLFTACNNDDNANSEPVNPLNPEELYAKTDYNLDMRDFAMAVNEAINTNASLEN